MAIDRGRVRIGREPKNVSGRWEVGARPSGDPSDLADGVAHADEYVVELRELLQKVVGHATFPAPGCLPDGFVDKASRHAAAFAPIRDRRQRV